MVHILPYVEQDSLYRQAQSAYVAQPTDPTINPPHVGFQTIVKLFGCPLDARVSELQPTHSNLSPALSSYLGVSGTDYLHPTGVLFADSNIRIADIFDGTSNTLLVGERPPSADLWYGWWYTGHGQGYTGSCDQVLGVREVRELFQPYTAACGIGPYEFEDGKLTNQCDVFHFWSLHSGGSQFVFADASCHFLSYSADPQMPALATRAGGESVQSPE
jgi:hypothetical protein